MITLAAYIEDTNDRYVVTGDGRVFDFKRNVELKQRCTRGADMDYPTVDIHTVYGRKTVPVHRLVAEAFIPNPYNKPTVDHIDRNPQNNHVENLRWATYREQSKNQGPRSKYIYINLSTGEYVKQKDVAKAVGCNSSVCRGHFNRSTDGTYKGFKRVKVNPFIYTP